MPKHVATAIASASLVAALVALLTAQSATSKLSSAAIASARGAPIARGAKEIAAATWGTTPAAIWSVDVAAANKTRADFVQNIRITNTHASNKLCIFDVAWSGVSTCSTLCAAASTRTCSGASTDGAVIMPGASYAESWDGTACLCAVGSAASTSAVAERVARFPG